MTSAILATKLFPPRSKPENVTRQGLLNRLDAGVEKKLTLISASAGSGKSTLLAEWIRWSGRNVAWLTLDEELHNPTAFLTYLVSGFQTVVPGIASGTLAGLTSPFPPSVDAVLTSLVNEIACLPTSVVFILDDYHRLDSPAVDQILVTMLETMPPNLHFILATREDPDIPVSRLRASGDLVELRMADLRFSQEEASKFFSDTAGLKLPPEAIVSLQARTEGWAAGLQMAALSLDGSQDPEGFVWSFTGSHRFVLDYLMEEVLRKQPAEVQEFLLASSVLERLCGPLCDAVLQRQGSQEMLVFLETANLFIVPLDAERRWYRYHQLFADMLRQRQGQNGAVLHQRAGLWLAEQGLGPAAFRHASAAGDLDQVERLLGGTLISTHDRAIVSDVLAWLARLPATSLDAHPLLWLRKATFLLAAGQTGGVEEALLAAEEGLQRQTREDKDELLGQIAIARCTVAVTQYQPQQIAQQATLALSLLSDESLNYRFMALSGRGFGQLLLGHRGEAAADYQEALLLSRRTGESFSPAMAETNMGLLRELQNDLPAAAKHYLTVLDLMGDSPQPYACEATLGLARVRYQWNELEESERLGVQALTLAKQYDPAIDRFVLCELFLAKVRLARSDCAGAAGLVLRTKQVVQERGFVHRLAEVAEIQVLVHLCQGSLTAAAELAQEFQLPLAQIRVGLVRDAPSVLTQVVSQKKQFQAQGWSDKTLEALVLEALVSHAVGEPESAWSALRQALETAGPVGILRVFLDEGAPLRGLLDWATRAGLGDAHLKRLLTTFAPEPEKVTQSPILSPREIEVLVLIARGLSNEAIGEALFVALDTVKGHNRRIFEKLQVSRRTEAVAQARNLGLIS